MKSIRSRLTYANVMATIALFIALGGASYAAVKVPKNSVGAKQLKKNAVTTAKVKNGGITGSKIKLSTLGVVPAANSSQYAATATSAAKATKADSAASADTATEAGSAATAGNALKLGGQTLAQVNAASKLKCPSGMTLSAGVCIETNDRASANYPTAISTCAAAGLTLPSTTELITFETPRFTTTPPAEWAGDIYVNGSTVYGLTSEAHGAFNNATVPATILTSHPYRCATLASN